MKILVGGDLIPTVRNLDLFQTGKVSMLLDDQLKKIWYDADYRVCNLETVLTDSGQKLRKHGRNIKTSPDVISGIQALNVSLLCCANNHILDYSQIGLEDTKRCIETGKIPYIGLSENKKDLYRYHVFEKGNSRVALYNCTDKGFSTADDYPGATPFDCYETLKSIKKIKSENDRVIVIYHAGIEFYQYPSPALQRNCRAMVEAGADIVICQHCHCIAAKESYFGAEIIYGHGHFISNLSDMELLKEELLLQIEIDNSNIAVNYIPVVVSNEHTLQSAPDYRADKIISAFLKRSELIKDEKFVQSNFDKLVKREEKNIVLSLKGHTWIDRIKAKVLKDFYMKSCYSEKDRLILYEFFSSCFKYEMIERYFSIRRADEKFYQETDQ